MSDFEQLDQYMSPRIRQMIEERYYDRINEQARLENAIKDPHFMANPIDHVALAPDRGTIHTRDVARQVLRVADAINGIFIPARDFNQLWFIKGVGVCMAYLHDIGLIDISRFGRFMHAELASRITFSPSFDDIADLIWEENAGNIAWRLTNLAQRGVLGADRRVVFREILTMSNCHSHSNIPAELLNDRLALRQRMQKTLSADLQAWYMERQGPGGRFARDSEAGHTNNAPVIDPHHDLQQRLRLRYTNFERDAYHWLVAREPEVQALAEDVIDALRVMRCADALRHRGALHKTSGGYEVFVNRNSGNAIYAMHLGQDELYLLEMSDPLSAGEANIASSELRRNGALRISFHRGAFPSQIAQKRAVYAAAVAVSDILSDVVESLHRPRDAAAAGSAALKTPDDIEVFLEGVADNLDFAELVLKQLKHLNIRANDQARAVPSLQNASAREQDIYLNAEPLDWDLEQRREVLARVARSGHKTRTIDPVEGFRDVKVVRLEAGTILLDAGAQSSFVYVPLEEGLRVIPLGGYHPFPFSPWIPLGVTGVIRGAPRNATVTADKDLTLLMIPEEVYLKHWHFTYSLEEFTQMLALKLEEM